MGNREGKTIKYLNLIIISMLSLIIIGCGSSGSARNSDMGTATYKVTFESTWSVATHPVEFPSNAHMSGLIGATHNSSVSFWEMGGLATPGIENMAETGSKSPLTSEIDDAIMMGNAGTTLSGNGISSSPGSVNLVFEIKEEFPLVTLVSMVAPSPDWFVGVSSISLVENGVFVDEKSITLKPYDAGRDGGISYRSQNMDTSPKEPVTEITGSPFEFNGMVEAMGTFTFEKQ